MTGTIIDRDVARRILQVSEKASDWQGAPRVKISKGKLEELGLGFDDLKKSKLWDGVITGDREAELQFVNALREITRAKTKGQEPLVSLENARAQFQEIDMSYYSMRQDIIEARAEMSFEVAKSMGPNRQSDEVEAQR